MELLREWIITIISTIIFIAFVEILIPNSKQKRYIDMVVGFLIVIVILNPLINIINSGIDFEGEILEVSNELELATAKNRVDNIKFNNNEAIVKLYKDKISIQLKNRIEENTEYLVEEAIVKIEEDIENVNFGSINSFDITLKGDFKNEKNKDSVESKIEPVQINIAIDKKSNNTVEANSILIDNEVDLIKDDISNFYSLDRESITIYIKQNN